MSSCVDGVGMGRKPAGMGTNPAGMGRLTWGGDGDEIASPCHSLV